MKARCEGADVRSLQEVTLFQAPITSTSRPEEIRRDLLMRLDKLVPGILTNLQEKWARRTVA
jgi:hypothetical protein